MGATDPLAELLSELDTEVAGWAFKASLLKWLTYTVALIGIVVSALQAVKSKWGKGLGVILPLMGSAIIAFNQTYFPADYRSFDKTSAFGHSKLLECKRTMAKFPTPTPQQRDLIIDQIGEAQTEIDRFAQQVIYGRTPTEKPGASTFTVPLLTTNAYAQDAPAEEQVPGWVENVPSDQRNIYFVAVADGLDAKRAKESALAKAREQAAQVFRWAFKGLKEEDQADLIRRLVDSVEISDSAYAPSKPTGGFRCYLLLKLSRSVAAFKAKLFLVERRLPSDESLVNKVASAIKPRIYMEIDKGADPNRVQAVKSALEAKGYEVPSIETVSGIRSDDSIVIFYKESDAEEANALLQSLSDFGVTTSREAATRIKGPSDARPRHFDLRLGKDTFIEKY